MDYAPLATDHLLRTADGGLCNLDWVFKHRLVGSGGSSTKSWLWGGGYHYML